MKGFAFFMSMICCCLISGADLCYGQAYGGEYESQTGQAIGSYGEQ